MPTLHFKGKTFLQNYHHSVKFHNLVAKKDKGLSKSPSLDDNLIIHGDNLKALKALLPTHAGKIKCIYIDPPYNTGNENWVYNDNVASPMIQKWLGEVVAKDDLTRHDKWCCMMYPRLTLLKELLNEEGIIFVSIDDNENHHLRHLLDEIFDENNFVASVIWEKSDSPRMDVELFSSRHDYILVYAKNKNLFKLNRFVEEIVPEHYNKTDENKKTYYIKPLRVMGGHESDSLYFALTDPDGSKVFPIKKNGEKGCWRWSKNKVEKEKERIEWVKGKNGWTPYFRIYAENRRATPPETIWFFKDVGSNRNSKNEIRTIFEEDVFDTPKPVSLIKKIIEISCGATDIILDSFAGSGTTGQAVLALNKEDGGNRKFILVECEDYADKITAERMRRVVKGISNTKDEYLKKGLGGTFSYYELGEPVEIDSLLEGKTLPTYEDLAKYAFFMATGEQFDTKKIDQKTSHIGTSSTFEVFLIYTPDKKKLKEMALNIDFAEKINEKYPTRQKLVFAPACFMEDYNLKEFNIRFAQLPFEIYRMAE